MFSNGSPRLHEITTVSILAVMAPTSGYIHFGWRSTQSVEHGTVWESLRVPRQCLQGFMQGFMMLNAVVFQAL